MKKTMIALALAGLTTSAAYASKARVEALGQDSADNYFINDSRSIWYNVSHIHDYKDMVMVEWGANGQTGTELDGEANPKAQGGFFRSMGNGTFGVYLGEESNTGILLRHTAESSAVNSLYKPENTVDVFYGMDGGSMRWAANVFYSSTKKEVSGTPASGKEQTAMAVRLGAGAEMWEAHANVSLKGESTANTGANEEKFDGSLGLHLGGAYKIGAGKVTANYKTLKWDIKNTVHTTAVEAKYNVIDVGYGHEKEVAGGTLFTQVYYRSTKIEAPFTTASGAADLKHAIIPLIVGFEAKATEWLTWRGSVSGNLHGKVENKGITDTNFAPSIGAGKTIADLLAGAYDSGKNSGTEVLKTSIRSKVAVAGGATLTFGKLSVDGMIGTTAGSRTGSVGTKNGSLSLDNLLTRVGMNYAF